MDCEYKNQRKFIRCFVYKKSVLSAVWGNLMPKLSTFYEESVEKMPKSVEKTVGSVEKIGQNFFSTLLNVLIISVSVEV